MEEVLTNIDMMLQKIVGFTHLSYLLMLFFFFQKTDFPWITYAKLLKKIWLVYYTNYRLILWAKL